MWPPPAGPSLCPLQSLSSSCWLYSNPAHGQGMALCWSTPHLRPLAWSVTTGSSGKWDLASAEPLSLRLALRSCESEQEHRGQGGARVHLGVRHKAGARGGGGVSSGMRQTLPHQAHTLPGNWLNNSVTRATAEESVSERTRRGMSA